jgi:hypothetical protein
MRQNDNKKEWTDWVSGRGRERGVDDGVNVNALVNDIWELCVWHSVFEWKMPTLRSKGYSDHLGWREMSHGDTLWQIRILLLQTFVEVNGGDMWMVCGVRCMSISLRHICPCVCVSVCFLCVSLTLVLWLCSVPRPEPGVCSSLDTTHRNSAWSSVP